MIGHILIYPIDDYDFLQLGQRILLAPGTQNTKLCIADYTGFTICLYPFFHPKTETFHAFRFQSIIKHFI